jgi:TonB family protein
VLSRGAEAEDYAEHLVQIVRALRGNNPLSLAAVSMAQPSQLETRLVSILDSRVRRRRLSQVSIAFLCVSTGMLTLSASAIGITRAVPLPAFSVVTTTLALPPAMTATGKTPALATKPAAAPVQRTRIGDGNVAASNTVVPPAVLESSSPRYTDEGTAAGIEGTVTLEASVDIDGKVNVLRVVKGLGYGLDQRAIGAVLDWKFAPATKDGVPVQTVTQIDVDFKLPPPRTVNGTAVLRIGGVVRPPTIISRVEPIYSDEARAAHYQGTVLLEAIIKKDGTVEIVRVVRSLGFGLDENATDAIKLWKFKPATRNGEPVDVAINIEVNFNLRDGDAGPK